MTADSTSTLKGNIEALLVERSAHGDRPGNMAELAEKMGVSRAYVSKVLRTGKTVNLETIDKVALAFGVTPAALITPQGDRGDHPIEECARRLLDRAGVRMKAGH